MNWTNVIVSVILFGVGFFIMGYACPALNDMQISDFIVFLTGMLIWNIGFNLNE